MMSLARDRSLNLPGSRAATVVPGIPEGGKVPGALAGPPTPGSTGVRMAKIATDMRTVAGAAEANCGSCNRMMVPEVLRSWLGPVTSSPEAG